MTDQIKFKYDIQNGAIEYEGAHELLKPTLKSLAKIFNGGDIAPTQPRSKKTKPKPKAKPVDAEINTSSSSKPKKGKAGYKPKYNSDLDLLTLHEFFDGKILKNNSECVVGFVVFLNESIKLNPISGDDIYTCFLELKAKLKMPGSFENTMKNAQNRDHMIKYDSGYTNIELVAKGSNLYHHDILSRQAAEK